MPKTTVTKSTANQKTVRKNRLEIAALMELFAVKRQTSGEAEAARQLELPLTTLRHWQQRKENLPCSNAIADFFEHPEGISFLHRLLIAIHFVLCYQPHGLRGVMQIIKLSGLDLFIANSLGTQQAVSQQIERHILRFGGLQREQLVALRANCDPIWVSLLEDETFHPKICLVAMDAVSRYIFFEQYQDNRNSDTWDTRVDEALNGLNLQVIQTTTDQAKALVSHAGHLQANHSPDLFHLLHEIAGGIFRRFAQKCREFRKQVEHAQTQVDYWVKAMKAEVEISQQPSKAGKYLYAFEAASAALDQALQAYEHSKADYLFAKEELNGISKDYHLVNLDDGKWLPPQIRIDSIRMRMRRFKVLIAAYQLGDKASTSVEKAERLLPEMLHTLEFVEKTIDSQLAALPCSDGIKSEIYQHLIPALYLHRVAGKVAGAQQRRTISALSEQLVLPLQQATHPIMSLSDKARQHIEFIANRCADLFQRSSSAVEGRNGHLALWHHHLHRLSDNRLSALTIVHNYHNAQVADDTPALRLFQSPHDNLFDYLLDNVDLPRRPAQKRTRRPTHRPGLREAA